MSEVFTAKFILGAIVTAALGTVTVFLMTKACRAIWPHVLKKWRIWWLMFIVSIGPIVSLVHVLQFKNRASAELKFVDLYIVYFVIGLSVVSLMTMLFAVLAMVERQRKQLEKQP